MQYLQCERHIREIVTYWLPAVDWDGGGIFYNMEPLRHRIDEPGRRAFLMHVRQIYNFSVGAEFGIKGADEAADHLVKTLDEIFDKVHGLYPFSPTASGGGPWGRGVLLTSYNQWYYVTAMARYAAAFSHRGAFDKALEHFLFSREAYKTENFAELGIYHRKSEDEGILSGKTGNDHLHYFEALIHLYDAASGILKSIEDREILSDLAGYLDEAETLFAEKLLDRSLYMTPDGLTDSLEFQKAGRSTTLGHPLEWFGFLFEAQHHLKRQSRVLEEAGEKLLNTNLDLAYADTGCFRSVYNFDEKAVYPRTDFWSQVEGILGALYGYAYYGDRVYLDKADDMWEFYRRTMCDAAHGGIYEQVARDGTPLSFTKGSPWKCDHHALRVCEKIIRYRLLEQ